jgi:hypothetical protein
MESRRKRFIQTTKEEALRTGEVPNQDLLNGWFDELRVPNDAGLAKFNINRENTVEKAVEKTLVNLLDQHRKTHNDAPLTNLINSLKEDIRTRNPKLSSDYDTKTWIERARALAEKLDPEEAVKLHQTFSPSELNLERPSKEFVVRNLMMAGSTILSMGFAAYSFATQGVVGGGLAAGIALAVNAGVNLLLYIRHDTRITKLVEHTKTQVKDAGSMPAAALWLGVLNHVLDKFNPIQVLWPEKCKPYGNDSTTTMEYTRNRLKDVADYVCSQIDLKPSQDSPSRNLWLHKDGVTNSKWAQIELNVDNFTARWSTIPKLLNFTATTVGALGAFPALNSLLQRFT